MRMCRVYTMLTFDLELKFIGFLTWLCFWSQLFCLFKNDLGFWRVRLVWVSLLSFTHSFYPVIFILLYMWLWCQMTFCKHLLNSSNISIQLSYGKDLNCIIFQFDSLVFLFFKWQLSRVNKIVMASICLWTYDNIKM